MSVKVVAVVRPTVLAAAAAAGGVAVRCPDNESLITDVVIRNIDLQPVVAVDERDEVLYVFVQHCQRYILRLHPHHTIQRSQHAARLCPKPYVVIENTCCCYCPFEMLRLVDPRWYR